MAETLRDVLTTMKDRARADAVLVASGDGLVLEAVSVPAVPLDFIAAYAASAVAVSVRLGEDAKLGAPQTVIHLYADKTLMIAPLDRLLVVLVGNGRSQMGMMRAQLAGGLPDLRSAVEREVLVGAETNVPALDIFDDPQPPRVSDP